METPLLENVLICDFLLELIPGTTVVLRSQLLDWACTMGHQQCLDYASIQFDQWEASPLTNP